MRFELTEHFCSSVFKTGAINRTLPHFHEKLSEQLCLAPSLIVKRTAYNKEYLGGSGRIQTYGFSALQAGALGHSATDP